jgi:(1->4)-alpha-D-glucan 1-alpha-D-glucosylmutase
VRVPLATYRVQVHRGFDLKAVRRIVPYIRGLGIDTVYLSPIVRSRRGSTHGYDVVDPNALDPDRGSPADLRSLVRTLRANRMGLLLDIVPNHMAASLENPWWKDVLTFGRASRFARVFDIDWDPRVSPTDQVVLPLLSHDVRSSFASAELAFEVSSKGLFLRHQAQQLPLAPRSVVRWLEAAEERGARDHRDPTTAGRRSVVGPREAESPCPGLGGDRRRPRGDGPVSSESSFRTCAGHLHCDIDSERSPKK